jgi:hypothetical protein
MPLQEDFVRARHRNVRAPSVAVTARAVRHSRFALILIPGCFSSSGSVWHRLNYRLDITASPTRARVGRSSTHGQLPGDQAEQRLTVGQETT